MHSSKKLKLLGLTMILLSGCKTQETQPAVLSNFCELYKPVCYNSDKDSVQTISQIINNEVVFLKHCPKQFEAHKCPTSLIPP